MPPQPTSRIDGCPKFPHKGVLICVLSTSLFSAEGSAQTLLSQYLFNGDLTNSSTFIDDNGTPAPNGTFRRGVDSSSAIAATPTFVPGVDGTSDGAILFDGTDGWVDATTAGHPGAPVPLTGTPTDDDPLASSGPGLTSGTAMAWVRSTNTSGARWIMGNLNADTPPFITDSQAWLMGWDGSKLEVFPRASNSSVSRFIVADPTGSTAWADGNWRHVAFRWNGAAEQGSGPPEYAAVFLDGVKLGAADTNFFLDETDNQNDWQFPMAIGARNNRGTLDGFFDGAIDDLRIYSDFLTDQQIFDIFDAVDVINGGPDADGDGNVAGDDFLLIQRDDPGQIAAWQAAFGSGLATLQPTTNIPEPATALLATIVLLLAPGRRFRSEQG